METLAGKTGAKYIETPLKSLYRAVEKSTLSESVGNVQVDWSGETVCDIVRGCLEFSNVTTMLLCFHLLCALDPDIGELNPKLHRKFYPAISQVATQPYMQLSLVDVKNRYAQPTSAGWADCCIRAFLRDDPNKHVFEIQLVHADMMLCRKGLGAHSDYAKSRAARELLDYHAEGSPHAALAVTKLNENSDSREGSDADDEPEAHGLSAAFQFFLCHPSLAGSETESGKGRRTFLTENEFRHVLSIQGSDGLSVLSPVQVNAAVQLACVDGRVDEAGFVAWSTS
jgi:hypothetical protein